MDKFVKRKQPLLHETDESSSQSESDNDTSTASRKQCTGTKKRKYDDDYIKYGFIESSINSGRPQCVICNKLLSNEALKPAKLKRHLAKQHPEFEHKPKDFFIRKKEACTKQTAMFTSTLISNDKALKASYLVAQRVARAKKPHTIAENLILPAALDMCEVLLGKDSCAKLKTIPLSNNTISRRISDMSDDIATQLIERLRNAYYAIQLDESTDIGSEAQLLVYVRYCWEGEAVEDFLMCRALSTRATGEAVFNELNEFFMRSQIPWGHCVGICTDGAASMTGRKSGVVARVKEVAPAATSTHCMIHREVLAAKNMEESLEEVFSSCVKIINFIKSRPLSVRTFSKLCDEMGAEHKHLLLHTEVRWLSRGAVLQRVFELREELLQYLTEYNANLAALLTDETWLAKLSYLVDIFNVLNALNLSMQGPDMNIMNSHDKISAFKKKLRIWSKRVNENIFHMFPTLFKQLSNAVSVDVDSVTFSVKNHLQSMAHYFDAYFINDGFENFDWIRNPFAVELTDLNGREEEELAELSCDRGLQLQFQQKSLSSFWLSVESEYPMISRKAVNTLLPFATSYLCETAFSALASMKTKHRSQLQVENDLRVCLSKITPRFDVLCKGKQAHPSH